MPLIILRFYTVEKGRLATPVKFPDISRAGPMNVSLGWVRPVVAPVHGRAGMQYPKWLKPKIVSFGDGPWESFERSSTLTKDGRVRIVPTPGNTLGHMAAIAEMDSHCVLIAGDAAYDEQTLLSGSVDGVAQRASLHHDSTRRLRELCGRRPTITQFAHDPESARRLASATTTRANQT